MLRARHVDAELDPGGKAKDLFGTGVDTIHARLGWSHLACSERPVAACVKHTPSPQLEIKFWRKNHTRPVVVGIFGIPYFSMNFQKHISP